MEKIEVINALQKEGFIVEEVPNGFRDEMIEWVTHKRTGNKLLGLPRIETEGIYTHGNQKPPHKLLRAFLGKCRQVRDRGILEARGVELWEGIKSLYLPVIQKSALSFPEKSKRDLKVQTEYLHRICFRNWDTFAFSVDENSYGPEESGGRFGWRQRTPEKWEILFQWLQETSKALREVFDSEECQALSKQAKDTLSELQEKRYEVPHRTDTSTLFVLEK